jgi:hypothetical protein
MMQSSGGSRLHLHAIPLLQLPLRELPTLTHFLQICREALLLVDTSTFHCIIAVGSIALKVVESAMCAHSMG